MATTAGRHPTRRSRARSPRRLLYNGFWAGLVTAQSGARRLGIHHQANGVVGRGVLLDVAGALDIDPFETSIDTEMLEETCHRQLVEVRPGDILLIRTGWLSAWLADPATRRRRQSGLAATTIPWLAEHEVAMVAADNRAVEVIPGPTDGLPLPFTCERSETSGCCSVSCSILTISPASAPRTDVTSSSLQQRRCRFATR